MQVNLKVIAGPYQGRIFSFTQHDTFLIGRSPEAHMCLVDDRFFSRNHCLLEINPPQSFLRDLGSTNGTFVNGQRASQSVLYPGDVISLAGLPIIFGQDNPPTSLVTSSTTPITNITSERGTAILREIPGKEKPKQ